MGGRIASQVVAQGEDVAGLALFAYPLHPPNRPEQRRDAHLPSIAVPTLFASGTRDTFGTTEELAEAARLVKNARVHVLDGADHGFNVLKASGRKREDVWVEATAVLLAFIDAVLP
jgi:predicted alpha/beta-hydrolase family hydrolase